MKAIARIQRNDQGLDGWNVYVERPFTKINVYPDAQTIYFEIEKKSGQKAYDLEIKVVERKSPIQEGGIKE